MKKDFDNYDAIKDAKSFQALLNALKKYPDYFTIALAYALAEELYASHLSTGKYNVVSYYTEEREDLKGFVYVKDKLPDYPDSLQEFLSDTEDADAIEKMLGWSLAYVCGVDLRHRGVDAGARLVSLVRVRSEIENAYKTIVKNVPEWDKESSLLKIKVLVLYATGWQLMKYADGYPSRNR